MNNDTPADAITKADILAWHKVQNAIAAQAIVEKKAAKKRGQPIGRELARKDALAFLSRYCTASLAAQDALRFGSPPEPVANPSKEWCDAYADWYYQGAKS